MTYFRRAISIAMLLSLSLAGCKTSSWFGSKEEGQRKAEKTEQVEEKRIAVLEQEPQLRPDTEAQTIEVTVPPIQANTEWTGNNVPFEHLALSDSLKNEKSVDAGAGAEEGYYLSAIPVVAEGKVFILDADMVLSAFSVDKLKKQWETKLLTKKQRKDNKLASGGVAYDKGMLYVTVGHDLVIALNAADGTEKWRKELNGLIRATPVVSGNKVLAVTIDNRTYALSVSDGSILWKHTGIAEVSGIYGSASPAANDKVVVVPHSSGELHGVRLDNGQELWTDSLVYQRVSAFTLADIDASPVIRGNVAYGVSNSGLLAADQLLSGTRLWEREIASTNTPWVAGNFLYVMGTTGELVAVYTGDGLVKWVTQLRQYENQEKKKGIVMWSGPVLAGGKLILVGSYGRLVMVSPQTGEIVDERKIPEGIYLPPVVAGGKLYLLTNDAELIVLG